MIPRVLFVPSVRKGNGSGHIVRCMALARDYDEGRDARRASIYLPSAERPGAWSYAELCIAFAEGLRNLDVVNSLGEADAWDLVVLDRRETDPEELDAWSKRGMVAAIDEGGEARNSVPYLFDVLPAAGRNGEYALAGNETSTSYLPLPANRRDAPPERAGKVLVAFGGEDKANLTGAFVSMATKSGILVASTVTVVAGALNERISELMSYGCVVLGPVQDLKERLRAWDLVVTQFGLTAFEAAFAGCAVLLLNPSPVHERLATVAGFASLGTGKPSPSRFRAAMRDFSALAARSAAIAPEGRSSLPGRIRSMEPRGMRACPSCGSSKARALHRAKRKTYLECSDCGLVRMVYFDPTSDSYGSDAYFFDDYKRQYGKTYIEDLPGLRAMARSRLDRIAAILGEGPHCALDVGCAYGAFAGEAARRGWTAYGMDISEAAVAYVGKELGIPAFKADFRSDECASLYPRGLDCVTMWYVIEHFEDFGAVLDKVRSLLSPGGIFAFSTPSGAGISARRDGAAFFGRSPDDHYTVLSPGSVRGILKRHGFEVQKTVVTGHHPERFPFVPEDPRSLRHRFAHAVSRLFGLGDTFECYCVKSERR